MEWSCQLIMAATVRWRGEKGYQSVCLSQPDSVTPLACSVTFNPRSLPIHLSDINKGNISRIGTPPPPPPRLSLSSKMILLPFSVVLSPF